jgi:PIN domain nuclease of toxin-antitoxin system
MIVLDSSAVLAFLFNEQGAERAKTLFVEGVVSSVNVTEIITKQVDRGIDPDVAALRWSGLDIATRPFDRDLAILAGKLRAATRNKGLSLGDRACLALAIQEGVTAATADRIWTDLDIGCKIELIR